MAVPKIRGWLLFVIGEQQRDAAPAIEVVDQRFLEQRVCMVRLHHATFSSLHRLDLGFERPSVQYQVLRNHNLGSTWTTVCLPRLHTLTTARDRQTE